MNRRQQLQLISTTTQLTVPRQERRCVRLASRVGVLYTRIRRRGYELEWVPGLEPLLRATTECVVCVCVSVCARARVVITF